MFESFVALGDSFTEGLDDLGPDGAFVGWADRVAAELAARAGGFRYANLAVRGRLMGEIAEEQVPVAVRLRPQLVSIAGGTNDVLRRHCDPHAVGRRLRESVARLTDAGSRVLLFTGTDPSRRMPWTQRLLPRIRTINEAALATAREFGTVLVELWPAPVFDHPAMWSEDRLHLSTEGHLRVASGVLDALGVPGHAGWRLPPPPAPPVPWHRARIDDVRWVRTHLAPWLHRRVTGRSSGETILPKRPELAPYGAGRGTLAAPPYSNR